MLHDSGVKYKIERDSRKYSFGSGIQLETDLKISFGVSNLPSFDKFFQTEIELSRITNNKRKQNRYGDGNNDNSGNKNEENFDIDKLYNTNGEIKKFINEKLEKRKVEFGRLFPNIKISIYINEELHSPWNRLTDVLNDDDEDEDGNTNKNKNKTKNKNSGTKSNIENDTVITGANEDEEIDLLDLESALATNVNKKVENKNQNKADSNDNKIKKNVNDNDKKIKKEDLINMSENKRNFLNLSKEYQLENGICFEIEFKLLSPKGQNKNVCPLWNAGHLKWLRKEKNAYIETNGNFVNIISIYNFWQDLVENLIKTLHYTNFVKMIDAAKEYYFKQVLPNMNMNMINNSNENNNDNDIDVNMNGRSRANNRSKNGTVTNGHNGSGAREDIDIEINKNNTRHRPVIKQKSLSATVELPAKSRTPNGHPNGSINTSNGSNSSNSINSTNSSNHINGSVNGDINMNGNGATQTTKTKSKRPIPRPKGKSHDQVNTKSKMNDGAQNGGVNLTVDTNLPPVDEEMDKKINGQTSIASETGETGEPIGRRTRSRSSGKRGGKAGRGGRGGRAARGGSRSNSRGGSRSSSRTGTRSGSGSTRGSATKSAAGDGNVNVGGGAGRGKSKNVRTRGGKTKGAVSRRKVQSATNVAAREQDMSNNKSINNNVTNTKTQDISQTVTKAPVRRSKRLSAKNKPGK